MFRDSITLPICHGYTFYGHQNSIRLSELSKEISYLQLGQGGRRNKNYVLHNVDEIYTRNYGHAQRNLTQNKEPKKQRIFGQEKTIWTVAI